MLDRINPPHPLKTEDRRIDDRRDQAGIGNFECMRPESEAIFSGKTETNRCVKK